MEEDYDTYSGIVLEILEVKRNPKYSTGPYFGKKQNTSPLRREMFKRSRLF